ncbi:Extracellular solute-binding protein OS=Streptomyces alboniger OX=132473 GN=CP975_32095 PE=4 SV=1 [Streptomyces alboniger]
MEFYQRLQALGRGPRDADEEHPPQAGVFAGGDVAQIIAVPGAARLIEEKNPGLKGGLGYFPIPGKKAGEPGAVFTGGSDLVVPERSDDHKGAVEVIEALVGKEWQTDLARTMNYVPNKAKLAPAVSGEEGAAAMAVGAANSRATPNSPRWAAVEADNPIKGYMTAVLTGGDPASPRPARPRPASPGDSASAACEGPPAPPGGGARLTGPYAAVAVLSDSAKRPLSSVHQ